MRRLHVFFIAFCFFSLRLSILSNFFASLLAYDVYDLNLKRMERVVIVIPYRDRDEQGIKFVDHMIGFARESENATSKATEYHIVFSEQFDETPFNRAWLFNIGFTYALESVIGEGDACVAVQDVDSYPLVGVDYTDCRPPTHLASEAESLGWGHMHDNFCGISFVMTLTKWKQINGMSNKYVGWGFEDNVIYLKMIKFHFFRISISVSNRHTIS